MGTSGALKASPLPPSQSSRLREYVGYSQGRRHSNGEPFPKDVSAVAHNFSFPCQHNGCGAYSRRRDRRTDLANASRSLRRSFLRRSSVAEASAPGCSSAAAAAHTASSGLGIASAPILASRAPSFKGAGAASAAIAARPWESVGLSQGANVSYIYIYI